MNLNKKEISVKRKLLDARKILRKKLFAIKTNVEEENELLKKTYQPLIEPLTKFIDTQHNVKSEIKQESNINDSTTALQQQQQLVSFTPKTVLQQKQQIPFLTDDDVFEGNDSVNDVSTEDDDLNNSNDATKILNESLATQSEEQVRDVFKKIDPLPRQFILDLINDNKNQFDTRYGVHFNVDDNALKIGNKIIDFEGKDLIVDGLKFNGTNALYSLLFHKYPKTYGLTEADLRNYYDILHKTSAVNMKYDPTKRIIGNKHYKYLHFIKPILRKNFDVKSYRSRIQSVPIGSGMSLSLDNKPYQYIYWNDINELIDRLVLLLASQRAGNNSHNNEIIAIEEELREANVII